MKIGTEFDGLRPVRVVIAVAAVLHARNVEKTALPAAPAFVRRHTIKHRLIGDLLQVKIKGGVHTEPRTMHLFNAILALKLTANLFDEVRRDRIGRGLNTKPQRGGLGSVGLRLGDLAILQHLVKNEIAAVQSALRVADRRVSLWSFGQRGKQRSFGKSQVTSMLGKEVLAPSLKAIRPVAEVDLIRIESEDLLLGESPLDLHGQENLLQLAPVGLLRREKKIPRELHRNRAGPLRPGAGMQIAVRRSHSPN